jgi:hypothetical protein
MTPFGSDRSKFASMKRPESTSGRAKKTTASGLSLSVRLSQRLKTMFFSFVGIRAVPRSS